MLYTSLYCLVVWLPVLAGKNNKWWRWNVTERRGRCEVMKWHEVTWQIVHASQLEESKEVKEFKEPKEETKEPQANGEISRITGFVWKKQIVCALQTVEELHVSFESSVQRFWDFPLNLIVFLFLMQGWILETVETLTRPPNGRVHCKIHIVHSCTFLFLVFLVGSFWGCQCGWGEEGET